MRHATTLIATALLIAVPPGMGLPEIPFRPEQSRLIQERTVQLRSVKAEDLLKLFPRVLPTFLVAGQDQEIRLRGDPKLLSRAVELIEEIDTPSDPPTRFYEMAHSNPETVAAATKT